MLIGHRMGPFEIEGELGSGAMGTVYKATYRTEGKPPRTVALKIVSLALLGNESALARFDREANILSQLRHPNIVSLIVAGRLKKTTPPTPIIAMEFIDGRPLDQILAERGRLGWEDVVMWGKQLCEALQHAHEKGIIHRDLKPSNLMITRDGTLKLTDFGIAKDTDVTALTGANSTIGTAAYMSPEQCKGDRNLSPKSDLYSLGIVFYELVTGRKPFTADTTVEMFLKHVNETPARPCRLVPDLPVWLDNLIMFLMEKNKDHRPLDAATVARMLGEIQQKVSDLQSVGVEVANAKRKDRSIAPGALDSGDLDAARSLRGGKKKRKKKVSVPWYRQTWVSIVGPLLVLAAMAYGVYLAVKPPGMDAVYAAVEAAPAGKKLPAAEEFLSRFGSDPDPRVEKVRDVFREEKVRDAEAVLLRRYAKEVMRRNSEGFDDKAYRLAMQAMDAEKAGDLGHAADLWGAVKDGSSAADPSRLPDPAETGMAVLGWVAEKRMANIRQDVPAKLAQITKQIADERIFENPKPYDPTQPESVAGRAVRYEQFPDKPKAKVVWERLAAETEKEPDQRVWFLLAGQQAGRISVEKGKDDEIRSNRDKLVGDRVAQLEEKAKTADMTDSPKAVRRDIRNDCRTVIALYEDELSEPIKAAVARAKKLLDSTK
jgi:eukaryotic-like serine/threonine-protein kinase